MLLYVCVAVFVVVVMVDYAAFIIMCVCLSARWTTEPNTRPVVGTYKVV